MVPVMWGLESANRARRRQCDPCCLYSTEPEMTALSIGELGFQFPTNPGLARNHGFLRRRRWQNAPLGAVPAGARAQCTAVFWAPQKYHNFAKKRLRRVPLCVSSRGKCECHEFHTLDGFFFVHFKDMYAFQNPVASGGCATFFLKIPFH